MINVAVSGAAGRMGETGLRRRGGRGGHGAGGPGGPAARHRAADVLGDADVVVDFSRRRTRRWLNARHCLEAGVHCVMGTTGADFSELEGVGTANLFVAPNFAIGAVLMMEAAKLIAPHMPECEIVELHHDQKLDAPSGTATRTAELIRARRRQRARADPLGPPPGLVAHQEVLFGGRGRRSVDPPRLDRARVVHARGAAGGAEGRLAGALADGGAREPAVARGPSGGQVARYLAHALLVRAGLEPL